MRVVTKCTKAFGQQHMERICIREPLNANDRYAVALKKDGAVVGHLRTSKNITNMRAIY